MITQSEVPFSLKDITVDWFTMALRESGLIDDEKILSLTYKVIGEEAGFNGEVAIFKLEYSDQRSRAPKSIVLKIPTALKNRTLGQTMGLYEKEIRFYRDLDLPLISVLLATTTVLSMSLMIRMLSLRG